ncbi:MAG: sigma-70 family RNA polymerase sigma factor [Prevotella sp.]|nr:sigma-70 family RNA polymerase sigma factor [Prevotella sp.]
MIDFTTLYNEHIDNLFAFGSRFSTNRELLKDCIQDVFVKLYSKREALDAVDNVESYLYVSLRNRINDEYRRHSKMSDDEIDDVKMRGIAETEAFNREQMEQRMAMAATVERYFEKLSPRQQQIINLYYREQMKYDDICRVMGINYQSVRNLMHRSITRLREYAARTEGAF